LFKAANVDYQNMAEESKYDFKPKMYFYTPWLVPCFTATRMQKNIEPQQWCVGDFKQPGSLRNRGRRRCDVVLSRVTHSASLATSLIPPARVRITAA